jgi:hypothetical protein
MRNAVHLPLINRIAAALGANTQLEVVVEGHTDSTGARSFNMHRSQRRARAAATHVESVTEWWFSMTEKISSVRISLSYGKRLHAIFLLAVLLFTAGCQTTYYAVWEKMGKEKRHLLKNNVEKAREEQAEASEQFATVVERIKAMYGFDGGELEDVYQKLSQDYRACEERADAVRDRIDKVERIAADLFREWESEIASIQNAKLKSKSRTSLRDTRSRFSRLQRSMATAEASMDPVLNNLRDYVLYLKHNLNAQAVSSLKKEVADIEAEVSSLIADMNRSIKEADAFVKTM